MASQNLELYNTDSESDSSEDHPIPKKKSRTQHKYNHVQTFQTTEAALRSVSQAKEWRQRYSAAVGEGRKTYDCKVDRNCPVKMLLFFEPTNQRVHMSKTEEPHGHPLKRVGLSQVAKEEINALLVVGVSKPRSIIRAFREKELPEPNIRKLSTYLASSFENVIITNYMND
jgi:hypothetical protein